MSQSINLFLHTENARPWAIVYTKSIYIIQRMRHVKVICISEVIASQKRLRERGKEVK